MFLISNDYIQSLWCGMEAKEDAVQRKPIVLLLNENTDEQEMAFVLKNFIIVKQG